MNEQQAIQILLELTKRAKPPIDVLVGAFDKQVDAIMDPAKLKSISCTRRAAKTYTSGLYLFREALNTPKVNVLYIGLTRDTAKRIMWKDVLHEINDKYSIGARSNSSELSMTLPNNSMIYLMGADADERQMHKMLGQKFKLIIIDEAASYKINLRELVFGVLKPTVADLRGTICLTGTAGNLVKTYFHKVVKGEEPGWSRHSWTTFDNPYMAQQWAEEIADLKAANPLIVETALFKQMYLNEWKVDDDKKVYKYIPERNSYTFIPVRVEPYRYILGLDLGYNDDTAFTVSCWHPHDPNLYFVKAIKQSKMDLTDVANMVKSLDKIYNFDVKVVDGSDKQAVMELNNRHDLNLIPADKTGKSDYIEIFNAELITGRIKIHEKDCELLAEEWDGLIWDEKPTQRFLLRRENPSCPNHLADSALYNWRYTYTYLSKAPDVKAEMGTPQWFKDETDKLEMRAIEKYEKAKQEKEWDVWQEEDDWEAA